QRVAAAAEVERSFLALAQLAGPHLAVLVVARQQLIEAEAAGGVAHLLLAELVGVDLDVPALLHRGRLLDTGGVLVVLVLHDPDVFLELVELVVLLDHCYQFILQPWPKIPRSAVSPRSNGSCRPRHSPRSSTSSAASGSRKQWFRISTISAASAP